MHHLNLQGQVLKEQAPSTTLQGRGSVTRAEGLGLAPAIHFGGLWLKPPRKS